MPGMKKDEVTVEIADDQLVLRGERKQEKEQKKDRFFKTERTYGSFFRMVPLLEGVKSEGAKAVMHDGVLEITVPMVKVEEKHRTLAVGSTGRRDLRRHPGCPPLRHSRDAAHVPRASRPNARDLRGR